MKKEKESPLYVGKETYGKLKKKRLLEKHWSRILQRKKKRKLNLF